MELKSLHDAFMRHEREDEERFASIGGKLADIHKEQINLKDNHWKHTQQAVESIAGEMKTIGTALTANTLETTATKTNVKWIMGIGGALLTALLGAVVSLIFVMLRKGAGL